MSKLEPTELKLQVSQGGLEDEHLELDDVLVDVLFIE